MFLDQNNEQHVVTLVLICHLHSISQDTLHYMMRELQSTEVMQPGIGGVKPISWSGIRHMISEVSLSVCLSVCLSVRLDKIFMVVATIIGQ